MTKGQRRAMAAMYGAASVLYGVTGIVEFALTCGAAALYYAMKSQ